MDHERGDRGAIPVRTLAAACGRAAGRRLGVPPVAERGASSAHGLTEHGEAGHTRSGRVSGGALRGRVRPRARGDARDGDFAAEEREGADLARGLSPGRSADRRRRARRRETRADDRAVVGIGEAGLAGDAVPRGGDRRSTGTASTRKNDTDRVRRRRSDRPRRARGSAGRRRRPKRGGNADSGQKSNRRPAHVPPFLVPHYASDREAPHAIVRLTSASAPRRGAEREGEARATRPGLRRRSSGARRGAGACPRGSHARRRHPPPRRRSPRPRG